MNLIQAKQIQLYNLLMIGIGHKQQKQTKIKIMCERAREYNQKYDNLIANGHDPQEVGIILQKAEYQKRHTGSFVEEPYKVEGKINQIGGVTHLGYVEAHRTLTSTQTLYAPLNTMMQGLKTGTATNIKFKKTQAQLDQQSTIKERIQRDSVGQNFGIDLGQKKSTDYTLNYNDDNKMKEIREHKDKQYHARKNQLNQYLQAYLKSKDSLRIKSKDSLRKV